MIFHKKRFFLILLLVWCRTVYAQDDIHATFTVDRGSPAIGEPIQLTLTVTVPAQSIVNMPQFPHDWSPFIVKTAGDVLITTANNNSIYQQSITVILWQPGDYQTPETVVPYQLPSSDIVSQIRVDPAFFTIPSVLNADDLALRPFKPPIALPYISIWLVGFIFVVGIAGTITLAYFVKSRMEFRQKAMPADALKNFHISAQLALRELKRISDKVTSPTEVYAQTADCLRAYIHGRFEIPADDMTTGELKGLLQAKSIFRDQSERELEQLLERADLVKFARAQPKLTAAQQFVMVADRWIQNIEQSDEAKEV